MHFTDNNNNNNGFKVRFGVEFTGTIFILQYFVTGDVCSF